MRDEGIAVRPRRIGRLGVLVRHALGRGPGRQRIALRRLRIGGYPFVGRRPTAPAAARGGGGRLVVRDPGGEGFDVRRGDLLGRRRSSVRRRFRLTRGGEIGRQRGRRRTGGRRRLRRRRRGRGLTGRGRLAVDLVRGGRLVPVRLPRRGELLGPRGLAPLGHRGRRRLREPAPARVADRAGVRPLFGRALGQTFLSAEESHAVVPRGGGGRPRGVAQVSPGARRNASRASRRAGRPPR